VAYDDAVKTQLLGVPAALIAEYGAVSEPVVRAMAEGAARAFGTEATLAVTGIAGPGGGTVEKPVGTVWLAARCGGQTRAARRVMPGDRGEIRERAAQAALDQLRRLLVEF
jgi:PncC family amidohydrolase